MSQNDFVIDNNTANAARLDIQSAFQALATNNSGASAPSTPYANQWWYETDTNLLKIRNEANTSWINVAHINQGTGKFGVLDDTKVVNTGGSQTGLLGDQATSAWEAGTGTTESLVSPAKVKAAIAANSTGIGVNQTWQDVSASRASGTTYTNNTGKTIFVSVQLGFSTSNKFDLYIGGAWVSLQSGDGQAPMGWQGPVPEGQDYRVTGSYGKWFELR